MNYRQKGLLIAMAVVVLVMLLYPRWQVNLGGHVLGQGYGWLFNPPGRMATVDIGLLITQWLAVLIIGGIAYLILRDR